MERFCFKSTEGAMNRHDRATGSNRSHIPIARRPGGGSAGRQLFPGRRGVCQSGGAVRLREIDAAVGDCRAGAALRRPGSGGRRSRDGALAENRIHAPEGSAVPLADHLGQRDPGPGAPSGRTQRRHGTGQGPAGPVRSGGICPQDAVSAVRRYAAAVRPDPHPGHGPQNPPAG